MVKESIKDYIYRLNGYSSDEIDKLIKEDRCPYEPECSRWAHLGMHRCPICGKMVLAGVSHPRRHKTPYTSEWPECDNGSDAFSMEDSWLDRTGSVK